MQNNQHSITIVADEYLYEILERIKQRPGIFKITSSHGWDSIILFHSADERDGLNKFFELFE